MPQTKLGRFFRRLRLVLIGRPLETSQAIHQRLSKIQALAVFSSDALSSTAYATEEILLILVLAGSMAYNYVIPIGSGHRGAAGDRRLFVPADGACLPARWRCLYRHQGQPWSRAKPARRIGVVNGLHIDCCREHLGRGGGDHVGGGECAARGRRDRRRSDRAHHAGKPTWIARERPEFSPSRRISSSAACRS